MDPPLLKLPLYDWTAKDISSIGGVWISTGIADCTLSVHKTPLFHYDAKQYNIPRQSTLTHILAYSNNVLRAKSSYPQVEVNHDVEWLPLKCALSHGAILSPYFLYPNAHWTHHVLATYSLWYSQLVLLMFLSGECEVIN